MRVLGRLRRFVGVTVSVRRALGYVWEGARAWTIVHIGLLLVQGMLPIASLFLLRMLVDSVVGSGGDGAGDLSRVLTILVASGAVVLLSGLARIAGGVVGKEQARRVVDHMNDVIHRKAIEVELEYYENAAYQDSLHRAQEEAGYRPGMVVTALSSLLQNGVSLLGVAWLLLTFQWQVFLLLLGALLPALAVRLVFSGREYLRERSYTEQERRSWYYHWLLAGRDLAKEVRVFGLGMTFIRRYRSIRQRLRNIRLALDVKHGAFSAVAQVFSIILIFSAYFWVARDAVLGQITVGAFVMFYQAFQKGQTYLQSVLDSIARLYENNLFLNNLYEFLDIELRPSTVPDVAVGPSGGPDLIVIEDVWFRYPGSETDVLKGVNLRLKRGQVAALVGLNGAGKTTLVKLLCRLYEPDKGRILVDGSDVRSIEPDELRSRIGVVFQDYPQYHLTVRDNIWLGDVTRPDDDPGIREAARKAGIDAKIGSLPHGYDTVLGRLFADGQELSIGEWQKLALSRAFFRNTHMVILDEPTSSMDARSEYELFKGFRRILRDRTALLISHRMSTVRMADVIFALADGRTVESGTHEELIAADGVYAGLYRMQAENFEGGK